MNAIQPTTFALLVSLAAVAVARADDKGLLPAALDGPLRDVQEIVFCTRLPYDDPHWYANIGYYCDDATRKAYPGNGKPDTGKLLRWNPRTGQVTPIVDDPGGTIRDPQVHYDAHKILFSYRRSGTDFFHLYEVDLDGGNLRQLTTGEFDDYEPTYLPDGGIAFVTTRCKRWVNCWMTQVGVIYRCEADGSNIRPISANTEHDNTPWPLPDGRLLYTRWEYVDRSQVEYHHLWTMNADGTGQAVYYGNMQPGILMIDAKPIPGSDRVIASFSPGHGVNEHAGIATIVSPRRGPDDPSAALPLHKGPLTRDPIALSETCVLAARDDGIVLLDGSGRVERIYHHEGPGLVHEPRPVIPRPRERVAAPRSGAAPTGRMILADVTRGRNLPGVARGEIRKLLVLESLPKPVNFSGGPDLTSWLGTFTLERVLGTVPVEPDGSAAFDLPAGRQIFFVALDASDRSVKRMQSFTSLMPGEVQSCIGCHESRTRTPDLSPAPPLQALARKPSTIEPFTGFPDVLDFHRDVQPVLDRHCVACHQPSRREGGVSLAGDLGPTWSHSYFTLLARRQVADGRNGLGNQPPRSIGSAASPLLTKLEGGHHDVHASDHDRRTVWLWIESGAPYAGTYAALRNEEQQQQEGRALGRVFAVAGPILQNRCVSCHNDPARPDLRIPFDHDQRNRLREQIGRPTGQHERIVLDDDPIARFSVQILVNFSRPELSTLLLGPLASAAGGYGRCGLIFQSAEDPDYRALLQAITAGRDLLTAQPRYATPGFRPNAQYLRELRRFGILPAVIDLSRDPIDPFDADQRYWRSLWWTGSTPAFPTEAEPGE